MRIDLNRFLQTFFQEAEEHLGVMESALLCLEKTGERDSDSLDAIFRCAHSIKGGSGTFGFDQIGGFTHALETLLDGVRGGHVELTQPRIGLLLRAVDMLRAMLAAAQNLTDPPAGADELSILLQNVAGAPAEAAEATTSPTDGESGRTVYRIRFVPAPELFLQGSDPILLLLELRSLGEVLETTADVLRVPPLDELDPETCCLGWTIRLSTASSPDDIRDVFAFVEDAAEITVEAESVAPRMQVTATETRAVVRDLSSIRVSTAKVDKLIDLVGELVIAQSMASEILGNFSPSRLCALTLAFGEIERYTRELQERVMGIRMLPVGSVFSRFPRVVRDLAASRGKHIELELSGEETELDKQVVESLGDPLTHLVRNAIDHGIEEPGERRSAGKPETGTIRLHAFHQGGNVMLEVSDDGRGLDLEKIRSKGIRLGLLPEGQTALDEAVKSLIFQPGFSTVETVSELSGRGVGMDVVKRNIDALNGSVTVSSERGRGATFRIKLPLTLAILDGLLLKIGAQTFVLPLVSILESIRPQAHQVCRVAGQGEVVTVRGEPLPLLRLHRLLNLATEVTDPTRGIVVLVEHQGRRLALLVDELLGQRQVVVKSLEAHFRKVEGVAGATILGDGQAALILDVAGVAQLASGRAQSAA